MSSGPNPPWRIKRTMLSLTIQRLMLSRMPACSVAQNIDNALPRTQVFFDEGSLRILKVTTQRLRQPILILRSVMVVISPVSSASWLV